MILGTRILAAVLLLLVAASWLCAQQHPGAGSKPFDAKDYPSDKFSISKKDYRLGELTVRVINVKNVGDVATNDPHACSAWIEVMRGASVVQMLSYDDIGAVGGNFGVLVAERQTADGYFLAVKLGDYDGRLLLIDRNGTVDDIPGGLFFVTADKKYLVSEYLSDLSEVAVYDIAQHRVAIQATEMPELGSWYRDDSGYFVMEFGKPGHAERLDLENKRVVKFTIGESDRTKATKVQYDFDPRKKQDCSSLPQ